MRISLGLIISVAIYTLFVVIPSHADVLIDPTRPIVNTKPLAKVKSGSTNRTWTLDSILIAPGRRVALINGQLVGEGDSVEGAMIIKIRKFNVLIQTRNKRIELQLLPDILTKQP